MSVADDWFVLAGCAFLLRLLDLGFQDEVEELVKLCPRGRQTMLFSATISDTVNSLAGLALDNPLMLKANELFQTATGLRQQFVPACPLRAIIIVLPAAPHTSRILT